MPCGNGPLWRSGTWIETFGGLENPIDVHASADEANGRRRPRALGSQTYFFGILERKMGFFSCCVAGGRHGIGLEVTDNDNWI